MSSAELDRRATPARFTRAETLRLQTAHAAGSAAALASRLARRGSGASIRGKVMERLDPRSLEKLLQGRRIAMVSGTNGKTTTTHLLAAALRAGLGAAADRLVTNADGANLHYGIASALGQKPDADIAVLETDERVVADVVRMGRPEVMVLLNFSRDQLDRHHEITSMGHAWRDALEAAGADGPVVVASAEEPLIVWACRGARKVIWVDTQSVWNADSALCPECGARIEHVEADTDSSTPGRWWCTGCSLAKPTPTWRVSNEVIVDPEGTIWHPKLQVPGQFNVSNAACALAAADLMGVGTSDAIRGMRTVTSPAGRFATATFGDTEARLMLAKNPAGWAEALPILTCDDVVLAIDSVAADGKDVSWLWDVQFEQLVGKNVVVTGPRCGDLSVRLLYAGVEHRVQPDLSQAMRMHSGRIDVLSTYTPFQKLRKLGGLA